MKISRSVFPALFAAIWPFCAAAQSLEPAPPSPLGRFVLGASQHEPVQATPWRAIVATQNRINRYFHRDVAPKLRGCWDALEGSGTVDAQFAYRRVGGRWVNNGILIRASTLPKNQDQAALRCLQEAVRDTSFAVERSDDTARDFEVNWSFPVPWPKDVAEAAKRMVDNGHTDDGGCGGSEGPGPACWDCFYVSIGPFGVSYCGRACSGYSYCTPAPNGCQAGPLYPRCTTGSIFGNIGGVVLY